jgi:phage/plasmid-like protein (TIGR03299 family)
MSDNINITNGKASFYSANTPAWHHLGEVVEGAQTWEEAIKLSGQDFEVIKEQNKHPRTGELIQSWNIYRTDTDTFLGTVGSRYQTIQNAFQFKFMDSILGEGGAHYETAGVLGKGERVFVLANLEKQHDIHGTGDIHKAYLAGVGSHDGSTGQKFFATDVRIVCQNTLQAALNSRKKGGTVNVRHTANAEKRILKQTEMLVQARDEFTNTMSILETLAERKVNSEIVASTVAELFGIKDITKEVPQRTLNAITSIRDLFESNDNDAFPQFRGTAYNLLNACTEYTDHSAEVRITEGRQGQAVEVLRADSAMFGRGAEFKSKALDLILEKTANAQTRSLHKSFSIPSDLDNKSALSAILGQYDKN